MTTHRASEDKLDPQDPARHDMQPPIPTHPPDALAAGDVDKVVGADKPPLDSNAPPHSSGISSGPAIDQLGGAGLGMAPGEGSAEGERPATTRDRDRRAVDQQDRTKDT